MGTFVAALPDMAGIPHTLSKPPGVALEDELHELGELVPLDNLQQQMDVIRHEAVVVELSGIAGLRSAEESEEILEGLGLREEELTVVAAGDEVIAAVVEQLARRPSHDAERLDDTI